MNWDTFSILICWHTYGYGVNVSEIGYVSFRKVVELVQTAPEFAVEFNKWLSEYGVDYPTVDDLEEFDADYCLGLVRVLKEVILEVENIELTACNDFDGNKYLLFEQTYPWRMSNLEKSLKEVDIQSLFVKYRRGNHNRLLRSRKRRLILG